MPDQAWLPTDLVPLSSIFHWQWAPQPQPSYAGYTCGHKTLDQLGATGVAANSATQNLPTSDPHYNTFVADQRLYFFPTETAAKYALDTIAQDTAACRLRPTAATTAAGTHQTASADNGFAFATYPEPNPGNTAGALREIHTYIVQCGPVISVMALTTASADGAPNADYPKPQQDQAVIAAIADHLSLYGTA